MAGEACALHKCDYDIINKAFLIRWSDLQALTDHARINA